MQLYHLYLFVLFHELDLTHLQIDALMAHPKQVVFVILGMRIFKNKLQHLSYAIITE